MELTIARHPDGHLSISWYRKPSASLRYINFLSNHTFSQKMNIVGMLAKRLYCFSDSSSLASQTKDVMDILVSNNYPVQLIRSSLSRYRTALLDSSHPIATTTSRGQLEQQTEPIYVKIPYVKGLSEQIRGALQTENSKIAFYHTISVGKLYSNLKDKIPLEQQSNIVYQLSCECGQQYVGQSKQYLHQRVKQHQYSLRRLAEGKLKPADHSGITQHISANPDHTIRFDDVNILDREVTYNKRLFKEAIHIYLTPTSMNLQTDVANHLVSTVYSNCVRRIWSGS